MSNIYILFFFLIFFSPTLANYIPPDKNIIRVGIYEDNFKNYNNINWQLDSILVKLLNHIARQENWKLFYIKQDSWDDALQALERGDIDVLPGVIFSKTKAKKYYFNKQSIIIDWAQIYSQKDLEIHSLLELEGKTIAVLKDSIHTEGSRGIKKLLKQFSVQAHYIEAPDYKHIFELLHNKQVDVGIVNRVYGFQYENQYKVNKSPVIFNPVHLLFAFSKNNLNSHIIAAHLDYQLEKLKENKKSLYYTLIKQLIGYNHKITKYTLTPWIYYFLYLLSIGFILFIFISGFLRIEINRKVYEIKELNQNLELKIQQRTQELRIAKRDSEQKLHYRSEVDQLLLKISSQFVSIPPTEIDINIEIALGELVKFSKGYASYIFLFSENDEMLSMTHVWAFEQSLFNKDRLQNLSVQDLSWWVTQIKKGEIIVSSIDALPKAAQKEQQILNGEGIQSVINVPLFNVNKVIGFIGMSHIIGGQIWNEEDIYLLKLVSQLLISVLVRNHLEKQFRHIFATMQEGYIQADFDGNILSTNKSAAQLLKYDEEALMQLKIGKDIFYNVLDEERLKTLLIQKGQVQNYEIIFKCKDNMTIVTECNFILVKNQNMEFYGTFRDITERKKTERALQQYQENLEELVKERTLKLQENQTMLQTLIDGINNAGIAMKDHRGKYLVVNQYYAEGLQIKKEDIIGHYPREIFLAEEAQALEEEDQEVLKTNSIISREASITRADGKVLEMAISKFPIKNEDGHVFAIVSVAYDITQRKKMEEELRKAKEAADDANQAKSVFLANMSHELRTPLNAILGFTQIMQRENSISYNIKDYVTKIHRAGKHLLVLINDVLEISKIEAGKLEKSITPFNLHLLLEDMQNMFEARIWEQPIEFKLNKNNVPEFIVSDEGKIRQVLINLLGNAVKFTNKGYINLNVNMKKLTENTSELILQVSDTGIGIAQEHRAKLFQPFAQLHANNKSLGGTGLGLSITKQYIELLDGKIEVESVIKQGSTFTVNIPVQLATSMDLPYKKYKKVVKALQLEQPITLLAVDDKPENLEVLIHPLIENGFHVVIAHNGDEALSLFKQYEPQLILMDMLMPVMDGYEATAKIKQTELGKNTPVIAITASVYEEQHHEIFAAGVDKLIKKPFEISDVLELIAQLLDIPCIYQSEPLTQDASIYFNSKQAHELCYNLSTTIKNELLEAASLLEQEKLMHIIKQDIEPYNTEIASCLYYFCEHFQYDKIINMVNQNDDK